MPAHVGRLRDTKLEDEPGGPGGRAGRASSTIPHMGECRTRGESLIILK